MRRSRLYALALLMLLGSGAPAACSGGVVGGKCRQGYESCDGRCVNPLTDRDDCGSCGHACGDGVACVEGVCAGPDASNAGGSAGAGGVLQPLDAGLGGGRDASLEGGSTGGMGGALSTDAGRGGTSPDSGAGGTTNNGGTAGTAGSTGTTSSGGTAGSVGTAGSAGNAGRAGNAGTTGSGGTAGSAGAAGAGGSAGSAGNAGAAGADAGPVCTPPFDTGANCGACGQRCPSSAPLCSLGTEGYFCTMLCQAPLVPCGTQCVNTDTDENNCGICGFVCASGLCQGGNCVGATPGHEIVFCMDYRTPATVGTGPEQLLENAVFLGSTGNVRILGYSEFASSPVVNTVKASLTNAAQHRGRTYTLTSAATSLDLANNLNVTKFDVLLVYDQPGAPAGRLAMAGAAVADAIDSFARAGGIVVVLASTTGRGEMADFIRNAGLLDVTGQSPLTGKPVYDRSPADAVGVSVISPFRAPAQTCAFTTTLQPDGTTVFVVTDSPSSSGTIGAPVVVHRVIAP